MNPTSNVPLEQHLQTLRSQGKLAEARALIERAAVALPSFATNARRLLQAHDDLWWAQPSGRRCRLRRRGPGDLAFIRALWGNAAFVRQFNPGAAPLPADDAALQRVLGSEFAALVTQTRSLHWTIESLAGVPFGVLSLVDLNLVHRRAELLVGVHQAPYAGAATEATLLAIDYAFEALHLNKLVALVGADNAASLAASKHIGFVHEGLLRQHIYDARSHQPIDLAHMALLQGDAAAGLTQQRVRRKLLGPALKAHFVRHATAEQPQQPST